jgi:RHS repeat-associated protein
MKLIIRKGIIPLLVVAFMQNILLAQPAITYPSPQTYYVATAITPPLIPTNTGGAVTINGQTTTLAGSFNQPLGTTVDPFGNVYEADAGTHRILKVSPSGVVTVIAGTGSSGFVNGTGTGASFNHPVGLAIDAAGNIYVADEVNNAIRKITPTGLVTTLAGSGSAGAVNGTGTSASFNLPCGVAIDASGNVYVADYNNNSIRKISPTGAVSTFAGNGAVGSANGTGTAATFNHPFSVTVDVSGNVYVADRLNNMIRKITSGGVVSTLAGNTTAGSANGTGTAASFHTPTTIAVDNQGNVYVADEGNNMLRAITPTGVVSTLSGTGATGSNNSIGLSATFYNPFAVTVDAFGFAYVGDYSNNLIRKVATGNFSISPGLPAGINFNTATGAISGTPSSVSGTATYTAIGYNSSGPGATSLSITVSLGSNFNPSQNLNYIATFTPRVANITNGTALNTAIADKTQAETTVTYFDGLGRPVQTVQLKGSPAGNDIVQPFAYDQFGREAIKYLPYALTGAVGSDGSYKGNALTPTAGQAAFYSAPPNGVNPISTPQAASTYELSPLNRAIEQGAPGDAWQLTGTTGLSVTPGHTVKTTYTVNEGVTFWAKQYSVSTDANGNNTLSYASSNNGNYNANMLYVTIIQNENWITGQPDTRLNTTEEYKDMFGHVVLKRTYNTGSPIQVLSTYYVYDDYGNLAYVLPPAANADNGINSANNQVVLDNLCYQYGYDSRNRLIQKKLPGRGLEYTIYNSLDHIVMTQDANQRAGNQNVAANQWTVIKYDAQGRTIATGLWQAGSAIPLATLESSVYAAAQWDVRDYTNNTGANPTGYVISSYPGLTEALTVNYYDDYTFAGQPSAFTAPTGASTMTKGLLTATKTAVLNTIYNTTPDMLWTVHYYDDLGRITQTYAQHYLGGVLNANNYDVVNTTYDFTNAPTTTTRKHYNTNNTSVPLVTVGNRYIYDHMGRKLKTWQQFTNGNNTPDTRTLISKLDYNEIGQVMTKHIHSIDSVSFLQDVPYTYNERGWLIASGNSTNLFSYTLKYNSPDAGTGQFNGNVAEMQYTKTGYGTIADYYTYDPLNRLVNATSGDNLNEQISYDLNGNIGSLTRGGQSYGTLSYSYLNNGNQLGTVNGSGFTTRNYGYDPSGNATSDGMGRTISYNLLNLPQGVSQQNNSNATLATYTYDAAGQKLRNMGSDGYWDYIDGIVYNGSAANNGAIQFIQTEEGRAVPQGSVWHFEYNLKDQLGNVRLSFDKDPSAGTARRIQEDEYYAFGLRNAFYNYSNNNRYLYNGKEVQTDLANQYDYGARFYDPVIGRWTSVDPSAENDVSLSPYIYGFDNSVRFTDPDGRWPDGDCCGVVGAFAGGLYNDLKGAVVGTVQAVIHPVNTLTGIAKLGMDPVTQMQAGVAIVNGASEGYQTFKNGDGNVRAAMIGGLVGEGAQLFGGEFAEAAKVGKIGELADKVGEVVKAVNGNSKASTNAQHIYEIVNNTTGDVEKVGVSGGKISQAGDSYRATGQVNKLKKAGGDYSSRIAEKVPAGPGARGKALEVEKAIADKNRSTLNPDIHQRP